MYLSTFECKNKRLLGNANLIHKATMMKFSGCRHDENVLFMVMNNNLIVQSNKMPSAAASDSFRLLHSKNCDDLLSSIKNGDIIRLYGVFEPTVRRLGHDYVLNSMIERMDWIDRKVSNVANVLAKNEKNVEKIYIENMREKNRTTNFYSYDLLIQVTDKENLIHMLKNGIGRSKAYGAGMCLILNIERRYDS